MTTGEYTRRTLPAASPQRFGHDGTEGATGAAFEPDGEPLFGSFRITVKSAIGNGAG